METDERRRRTGKLRISKGTDDDIRAPLGELVPQQELEIALARDRQFGGRSQTGRLEGLMDPRAKSLTILVVDVEDEHAAQRATHQDLLHQECPFGRIVPGESEHPW